MVSWCLLTLTALLLCCVKDVHGDGTGATYTMFVNNGEITEANGVLGRLDSRSSVQVACRYLHGINEPDVYKIDESQNLLNSYVQRKTSGDYEWRTYILTDADKQGTATYRCIDKNKAGCPDYSQVTISFTTRTPSSGPVLRSGCPPGGSNDRPSTPSNPPASTSAGGGTGAGGTGAGQTFAGLNPLIYTISAVVLLGTLAIVAIITCWIRARRSYNRRMFQSSANPQDYLDYISDNEFTPLTTSEFVASLQERPPTYHESEEIEGQTRPKDEGDDGDTETGAGGGGGGGGGEEGGGAREGGGAQSTTTTSTTATNTSSTSTSTNARSRPPRPPPPLTIPNSNHSQPSSTVPATSSSSSTLAAAAASSNEDAPDLTSEDRPPVSRGPLGSSSSGSSWVASRQGGNEGGAPDDNVAATGASSSEPVVPVLSGIDALLSIDLSTGNGNGTQTLSPLPASSSNTTTESAAVGTLIDFGNSNSDSSSPVVSSSQSTFHSIPQPTPEQISEMEAAIGALNKHMTRIRERTE